MKFVRVKLCSRQCVRSFCPLELPIVNHADHTVSKIMAKECTTIEYATVYEYHRPRVRHTFQSNDQANFRADAWVRYEILLRLHAEKDEMN